MAANVRHVWRIVLHFVEYTIHGRSDYPLLHLNAPQLLAVQKTSIRTGSHANCDARFQSLYVVLLSMLPHLLTALSWRHSGQPPGDSTVLQGRLPWYHPYISWACPYMYNVNSLPNVHVRHFTWWVLPAMLVLQAANARVTR